MKKRFFNTAVAIAAAMSLSVCAFAEAADPGISLPGFSGLPGASDATVGAAVGKTTVRLGSDEGVLVTGPASAFKPATYVYLGVSLDTNLDADTVAYAKGCAEKALAEHKPTLEDDKMTVNTAVRLKLYDQDKKELQPKSALTVKLPYDGKSNIVAYIAEDGSVEWIKLDTSDTSKIMTFKTSHFSDFYFLKLREGLVETLTDTEEDGTVPGQVTTTPSGSSTPGGGSTSSSDTTTTQAPEATTTAAPEATTTKAPDATTAAPSGSDDKPGSNDNTPSGGNTTNAPADDDNGNSNVGNDGAGNGADKNQATGVVLAVIPAAIAAAAVVISKKRK